MPDALLQQKIYPYDGTQDSTKNPILISPKDVVDADNIVYTTYSTKKLRPGVRAAFDPDIAVGRRVLGAVDFWRLGQRRVVFYDGQHLHAVDPATGLRDDITAAHVLPIDETISFEVYTGLLIAFFGGAATPPKAWTMTGAIANLGSTASNAAFGRVWLNRLWIPDPTIPGRLLVSRTGDPTLFTGGDSTTVDLDVNDADPDGITAIFPPFFGSLYVAKRLSIYKVTPVILAAGTVVFSYSKISDGIGCISHNAVVAAESNIFFPSDWGWHTFESTDKISAVDTDLLSRDIQPEWVDDTNFLRSQYIQAVYDRSLNSIIALYPTSSRLYPDSAWGFSLAAKKWYRWRDFGHTCLSRYLEPGGKRLRTLVGSDLGQIGILDQDIRTDYGKKFGCSFQSGIICPGGAPDEEYTFNYMAPLFAPQMSGEFSITYKVDGETVETKSFQMATSLDLGGDLGDDFVTGVTTLGGVPRIAIDKRQIKGRGMTYELFVTYDPDTNDVNEAPDFELLGIFMDVAASTKSIGERVA